MRYPEHLERHKLIYEQHRAGKTYVAIAKELGITPVRVGQLALRWKLHLDRVNTTAAEQSESKRRAKAKMKTIKEVLQAIADGEMPNEQVLREATLRLGVSVSMNMSVSQARKPGPCFKDERHEIKAGDLYVGDQRGGFMANDRYCVQCGARMLLELGAGDRPPFQYAGLDESGFMVLAETRPAIWAQPKHQ